MGRTRGKEPVDTDLRFHQLEWRSERIGWAIVAIFLTLALAGLFGNGPLSHVRAGGAAGSIEYERFVRNGSPTELVVRPTGAHGVSRIEITAKYLEGVRVQRITPEPIAVRMKGERLVYEFAAGGASVSFHIDPQRLWQHTAQVTIDAGAPLELWQLTYP